MGAMNLHAINTQPGCPHFPGVPILSEAIYRQMRMDWNDDILYGELLEVVWDDEQGAIGRWRMDQDSDQFVIRCYEILDRAEAQESYRPDDLPIDWYVDYDHTVDPDTWA